MLGGVVSTFEVVTVTAADVVVLPAGNWRGRRQVVGAVRGRAVPGECVRCGRLLGADRVPVELELDAGDAVSSEAFAARLTVPVSVASFAGAVIETVGGAVSAGVVIGAAMSAWICDAESAVVDADLVDQAVEVLTPGASPPIRSTPVVVGIVPDLTVLTSVPLT